MEGSGQCQPLEQGHDRKTSFSVDAKYGCRLGGGCLKKKSKKHFEYPETLNFNPFSPGVHHKKKAFLCGVSYQNQKYKLEGTINDVIRMRNLLMKKFKYPKEAILVLTEWEPDLYKPIKNNIQEGFKWLVKDTQPGDSLVFYYSGHGLRQFDFQDDELDGFDESLCPLDFKENGIILDNEINDTIVRPLIKDVTLHAIVDSCHSGTILDLRYVYDINTKKWEDNNPPSGAYKGTNGGWAICISACTDKEYAADTDAFSGAREMTGAMTYTLVDAVEKNSELTYYDLHLSICKAIKKVGEQTPSCTQLLTNLFQRKIRQNPQLSSSKIFDTRTEKFQL